ncbi:hypothetical protein V2J09_000516 [Rumex salicifolius]
MVWQIKERVVVAANAAAENVKVKFTEFNVREATFPSFLHKTLIPVIFFETKVGGPTVLYGAYDSQRSCFYCT